MYDGSGTDEVDAGGRDEAGGQDVEVVGNVIVDDCVARIWRLKGILVSHFPRFPFSFYLSTPGEEEGNLLCPPAARQQSVADWERRSVIFPLPELFLKSTTLTVSSIDCNCFLPYN